MRPGGRSFSVTAAVTSRRQRLHDHLARRGLSVFFDKTELQAGDRWLDRLQAAVDGCGAFVLLAGRDGVARWVGAETQAALNRHFGARGDADRLPIFPVLLDGIGADALPAFSGCSRRPRGTALRRRLSRYSPPSATGHCCRPRRNPSKDRPLSAPPPSGRIKRICSLAGNRRRWRRSHASTRAPVTPPSVG